MHRTILLSIAVLNIFTGLQIFFMPEFFYENIPGVKMMGPFNLHFIRDAGLSFCASALLMGFGWHKRDYSWSVAGAIWPVFHALFHLQMWVARGFPADLVAAVNFVGIQLPAWAAMIAAIALYRRAGEKS